MLKVSELKHMVELGFPSWIRWNGLYRGQQDHVGISLAVESIGDLIALGAFLRVAGYDELLARPPHIDHAGQGFVVSWDLDVFEIDIDLSADEEDAA